MPARDGTDVEIRISDGSSPTNQSYVRIGGMVTEDLEITEDPTVVTSKTSGAQAYEQRQRFGIRQMSFSGEGIFEDSAGEELLRAYVMQAEPRSLREFQFYVPGQGTYQCKAIVSNYKITGPKHDKVGFSAQFVSADDVSYTSD